MISTCFTRNAFPTDTHGKYCPYNGSLYPLNGNPTTLPPCLVCLPDPGNLSLSKCLQPASILLILASPMSCIATLSKGYSLSICWNTIQYYEWESPFMNNSTFPGVFVVPALWLRIPWSWQQVWCFHSQRLVLWPVLCHDTETKQESVRTSIIHVVKCAMYYGNTCFLVFLGTWPIGCIADVKIYF